MATSQVSAGQRCGFCVFSHSSVDLSSPVYNRTMCELLCVFDLSIREKSILDRTALFLCMALRLAYRTLMTLQNHQSVLTMILGEHFRTPFATEGVYSVIILLAPDALDTPFGPKATGPTATVAKGVKKKPSTCPSLLAKIVFGRILEPRCWKMP